MCIRFYVVLEAGTVAVESFLAETGKIRDNYFWFSIIIVVRSDTNKMPVRSEKACLICVNDCIRM